MKFFLLLLIVNIFCCLQQCAAQDNRIWATYYGGTDDDIGYSLATDAGENVYLAGFTLSASGIAAGGFQNTFGGIQDAFLVKFDSNGNRLWATYYGGIEDDIGYTVATDIWGNAYLAGNTLSNSGIALGGFQNTYGGGRDAFLVKFDSNGNRLWATYYGGINDDIGFTIATDASGNVYLAGQSYSASGISSGGYQNTIGGECDAFLVKFDSNGNRLWATYYGGTELDGGRSLAIDAVGNVYLAGYTYSPSGIASGGFQNTYGGGIVDAFLVKFDSNGNRLWATYYGGTSNDGGNSLATDAGGNVYLAGITLSASGIASGGFQNTINSGTWDVFLVKFNSTGNRIWATYYGGTGHEENGMVATDTVGNVYLAGDTYSSSGIASGGFQNSLTVIENEFVVTFDSSGMRLCATYYGQGHDEEGQVAVDGLGNVYLSGRTNSVSGIAADGFQDTFGGYYDAYLVKFTSCSDALFVNINSTNPGCNGQCNGSATINPLEGIPPYSYVWSDSQTTQTATGLCAGNYSAVVTDSIGSTSSVTVTITEPDSITIDVFTFNLCNADTGTATAQVAGGTPGYTYLWNTTPSQTTQTATGLVAGIYEVTVSDANGCSAIQSFEITDTISFSISITQNGDTLFATTSPNYQWYFNDTLVPGATTQNFILTESGYYYVVTVDDSCIITSNIIETSCICVSISENELSEKIVLYPNPTNGNLILKSELLTENAEIKIYNTLGQQVFAPLLSKEEDRVVIYVSHLANGTYYLSIVNDNGVGIKRFEVIK